MSHCRSLMCMGKPYILRNQIFKVITAHKRALTWSLWQPIEQSVCFCNEIQHSGSGQSQLLTQQFWCTPLKHSGTNNTATFTHIYNNSATLNKKNKTQKQSFLLILWVMVSSRHTYYDANFCHIRFSADLGRISKTENEGISQQWLTIQYFSLGTSTDGLLLLRGRVRTRLAP